MVKRKMVLSIATLIIIGVISLNLTTAIMNNQSIAIYYDNQLFTNTLTPKTTSEVTRLNYNDTLYQASNKILHLWPCHISQGRNGIIVYSNEGAPTYNLTAIELEAQPKQIWQISFSSPISYCWVADLDGDSYDDLAAQVVGGNLTIYNGINGSEINTLDIGSRVIATANWDSYVGFEILLISPPFNNGTHVLLNLTLINNITSLDMDNSTYYLNQTNDFTFAVDGDWDLSSPGTEVVLMNATGGSIYVLRSADWTRSKTEMVNASVITLPGAKSFSNFFDFRSPFFAFYMSGSDIGVFYNNSIRWTIPMFDPYIKLVELGNGVKLVTTYPKSGWTMNYTIYDALTGSVEYEGKGTLTSSHPMSDNKNRLFAQWGTGGYSLDYYIYQTDFSISQPSAYETLLVFQFYSSTFYIRDSVLHSSITVFGDPAQIGGVRFFTYLRDFNGDGKIDMLGLSYLGGYERVLELYSLEPTRLTSTSELVFKIFNLTLYLRSSDLRTLGFGLSILIGGIALTSVYYIQRSRSLVATKKISLICSLFFFYSSTLQHNLKKAQGSKNTLRKFWKSGSQKPKSTPHTKSRTYTERILNNQKYHSVSVGVCVVLHVFLFIFICFSAIFRNTRAQTLRK